MSQLRRPGTGWEAFELHCGGVSLSLVFKEQALTDLTNEIGAGFNSIPRRGAEVGGILAGRMALEGSAWTITIESVIPAPIRYEYGPSYKLSATDSHRFRELAIRASPGLPRIGWYRSNTRSASEPDGADRQISRAFFKAEHVFLFCEPSMDGSIRARCMVTDPRRGELAFAFVLGRFTRLGGAACAAASVEHATRADGMADSERPERRFESAGPMQQRNAGARAGPSAAAALATAFRPAFSKPVLKLSILKARASGIVLAVAIAAVFLLIWLAGPRAERTPAVSPAVLAAATEAPVPVDTNALGLHAQYEGNAIRIEWNHGAQQLMPAAAAVTISDGGETRLLTLSERELEHGSILYRPKAGDIDVELRVTSRGGGTASQSLRIIDANASRPVNPVLRPPAASVPAHTAAAERKLAQFMPPPDPNRRERGVTVPAVPQIAAEGPPMAPANLSPQLPAEPDQPGREALAPPARAAVQPAIPMRSPQPLVRLNGAVPAYALNQALAVKVEVKISERGRVTSARLVGESGAYAMLLGPAALNAARQWTFRPATLRGKPVESTAVLTFRYAPPAAGDETRRR